MKILTKMDLEDYLTGATILGCGGGGSVEGGRALIGDAFEKGFKFRLADITELPDNEIICILGWIGGGVPKEVHKRVAPYLLKLKGTKEETILGLKKAAKGLSDFVGKEFYSYIASETGPENGVIPMYISALQGKPCVDGDCCGRAKPEIAISLTNVAGIPITPLCIVTPFGETLILKSVVDDRRAEDLCRYNAIASGGKVYVARCPAKVAAYRKGIATNQVTKTIKVGEVVRIAKSKGRDPVEAFIAAAQAEKLFEGVVMSLEVEGKAGFHWGNWHIKGTGEFRGRSFRVWFKNEHLLGWLDEEIRATCPDLICIVESGTGQGLSNFVESGEHNGKSVAVVRVKAHETWKTKKGLELFGPRYFGYEVEYKY